MEQNEPQQQQGQEQQQQGQQQGQEPQGQGQGQEPQGQQQGQRPEMGKTPSRVRTYIDHLERQLETVRAAHAQEMATVRAAHAHAQELATERMVERDFLRRIIETFANRAVAPTGFNWVRPQTPLLRPFVNHPNFFQGIGAQAQQFMGGHNGGNGGGNHWWQNAPGHGVPFGGAVANNGGQGGYGQNIVPGLNGGQGGYGQNIVPAQAGAGGVGYFPAAYQQHGGQNVPGGGQ